MSQDFNQMMTPNVNVETKEDYNLANGHIVKWGVLEIMPHREEVDALGEIGASGGPDPSTDIRKVVPWEKGIRARLVALKSKDRNGNIRELFAQDPSGNVSLVFGPKYMHQYVSMDMKELENGWARKYNREGRKLSYDVPEGFMRMTPMERYAYWLAFLGGRYGFEPGAFQEGAYFYAYFLREKSNRTGKWWSNCRKMFKDDLGWHDDCPAEIGTIDVALLQKVYARLQEAWDNRDDSSFNYGANTTAASTGYTPDEEAGF